MYISFAFDFPKRCLLFECCRETSGKGKYSKWREKGSEIGKLTRSGASCGTIS